jgi:hypothetical protein
MTTPRRSKRTGHQTDMAKHFAKRWYQGVITDKETFFKWPNVKHVTLGWKEKGGKVTRRIAVKIYVTKKVRNLKKLSKDEVLPSTAQVLIPIGNGLYKSKRVPTDVVWHAPAKLCGSPGDFLNPIEGGAWVAVPAHEAGTYACMVADQVGRPFAVTAGHVVQNPLGKIGSGIPVIQPAVPSPTIPPGSSPRLGRTVGGFFGNLPTGFVDFALIQLFPERAGVSSALDGLAGNGPILSSAFVITNRIQVSKFGAVSGRTRAIFSAPISSIVIGGITVINVFEFLGLPGSLFGKSGDSGSLVVSTSPGSQGGIVGLLFATTSPTEDAPGGRGYVFPFERMTGLRPI